MNLKEFARHLNLSTSTISRAFRNSYDISLETKQRIWSKAKELNYQPNPLASSLRSHKTRTIAVILPEIANNFFTLAINGIEAVAQEQGYHVLIYITHEDAEKQDAFIHSLQSGRVDGILISLSQDKERKKQMAQPGSNKMPVVYFDRVSDDATAMKVTTNDYESGYLATQHLIQKGCKKIAHLFFRHDLSISQKRMEGYLAALADHKLRTNQKYLVDCTDSKDNYAVVKKLLNGRDRPDAIFSSIEKLALLSYQVCSDLNLAIPKDVKLITFSNLETAPLLNPSLTTITQPAYEIGKTAASLLFKSLSKKNSEPAPAHIILKSELIERGST